MKFKTIISEAMIDTLSMNKFDKTIMKLIHKELTKSDTPENFKTDDLVGFLTSLSKKVGVDTHQIVSLYLTYVKYKDFLFSEEGIEKVTNYDVMSPELIDLTGSVLLTYLYENFNDKEIFNNNGISGVVNFYESLKVFIEEEMTPEVYVTLPVEGQYENGEDASISSSIHLSILPTIGRGYGFDFINFNDEAFGEWLGDYEGKRDTNMIDTGWVKESFLKPPKNYSDIEIKRFCEQWVEVVKRIIAKNSFLFFKYKDFVEHGGVFENYKMKRKTIK